MSQTNHNPIEVIDVDDEINEKEDNVEEKGPNRLSQIPDNAFDHMPNGIKTYFEIMKKELIKINIRFRQLKAGITNINKRINDLECRKNIASSGSSNQISRPQSQPAKKEKEKGRGKSITNKNTNKTQKKKAPTPKNRNNNSPSKTKLKKTLEKAKKNVTKAKKQKTKVNVNSSQSNAPPKKKQKISIIPSGCESVHIVNPIDLNIDSKQIKIEEIVQNWEDKKDKNM